MSVRNTLLSDHAPIKREQKMRSEFVRNKSKPHMNEKGVANLCAQVKYAQDVASSRTVRFLGGLCRVVQHENDQELSSEGTAN